MAASDFVPGNDLERHLLEAQRDHESVPRLMQTLLASKVVMMLDRAVPESGWDNSASPLVLNSTTGTPLFAIFTSIERAKPSGSHQYALLVDFKWILRGIAPGVGLVVNAGLSVGLEMPPEGVAELKRDAAGQ